jgi:hypothetical protein
MPIPQPKLKPTVLENFDPNYPKALYKKAPKGQGEEVSPAYPRIVVSEAGQAQRVKDRHPYVTCWANDADEEALLVKDGWQDTPISIVN